MTFTEIECKKCENSFGIFELKNGICKSCIEKENPTCPGCKKIFNAGEFTEGYCQECYEERKESIEKRKELEKQELELIEKKKQEKIALKKAKGKRKLDIQNIMLTTETQVNLKIEKSSREYGNFSNSIIHNDYVNYMNKISNYIKSI